MSAAFITAGLHKEIEPGDWASGAAEAIEQAFAQAGVKPARAGEFHWLAEEPPPPALESLAPGAPLFTWPAAPLVDAYVLQSASRAVWMGEQHLVLLAQRWQQHLGIILLASPVAVGRFNLMPHAQISARVSLRGEGETLLEPAAEALNRERQAALRRLEAARAAAPRQEPTEEETEEDLPPSPAEIDWVACGEAVDQEALGRSFANARRLAALPPAPQGDLFLLDALCRALRSSRGRRGLLLSGTGPTGLGFLIERV